MATIETSAAGTNGVRAAGAKGYGVILGATVMWSASAVILDYLLAGYRISPLTLGFWRMLLSGLSVLLFLLCFRPHLLRVGRAQIPFLVANGVLGVAAVEALWNVSVHLNGAGVATALIYAAPAFVAVISWRLFDESLGWAKVGAIALTLAGAVLVAGVERPDVLLANPAGAVVGLVSAFGFALWTLFGKAAAGRMNPWAAMGYSFTISSFALLTTRSWSEIWSLGPSVDGWLILAVLALGPTVLGDGLYLYSMSFLPASVASIVVSLEPAVTAGMAYLVLGERLTPVQWAGGGCIVAAVALLHAGGNGLEA